MAEDRRRVPTREGASGALALKFLLELAAVAGYAIGLVVALGWLVGGLAAVVAVGLFVVIWGRWCAPRAAHRLPVRARAPLELVLLLGGAAVLALASPIAAVVVAALIVIDAVLLTAVRQWDG